MTLYSDRDLGQHCSCNGLLRDDSKPLPEPMLPNYEWGPVAFFWGQESNSLSEFQNYTFEITSTSLS